MSAAISATDKETTSDNSPETAQTAELKSFPRTEETARKPDATAETVEAAPASPEPKRPGRRRAILAGIALLALAGTAWYGHEWWTVGRFMVSTDNAYVSGDIATISPKVSGYVEKVLVADKGYDDRMGARPLGRVIQEHIKKPLAEELLFGRLAKGGTVRVSVRDDKIALDVEGPAARRLSGKKKPPLLTAE